MDVVKINLKIKILLNTLFLFKCFSMSEEYDGSRQSQLPALVWIERAGSRRFSLGAAKCLQASLQRVSCSAMQILG